MLVLLAVIVCLGLAPAANAESHGVHDPIQMRPNASNTAAPDTKAGTRPLIVEKGSFSSTRQNISSALRSVLSNISSQGITRANVREMNIAALANPLVRIDPDGRIQVYVYLASLGEAELDVLRSLDVEVEVINKDPAIVQGLAPFDRIEEIAASPFVQRVTQPSYGRPRAGSKTTEGDTILKADQLRALGIDGTEMKVGIISDGANNWIKSQASGDLPASGITRYGSCTPSAPDFQICRSGRTRNEGTAMAEIVHDIAPGARIAVAAAGTSLEFIARVNDLVNIFGADIIVDDLGFCFEPHFEDGLLAQAVAGVKDQVVFVSSAGNAARKHYEADYKDNSNLHDFGLRAGGSTDLTMDVLAGPGKFLFTVLQWNDQFGLSANDYDLFLFDGAETTIVASSRDLQDGTQDPREFVCYFNPAFSKSEGKSWCAGFPQRAGA